MSDDRKKAGKPDRIRVSLKQKHEVSYWTGQFGVTKRQLQLAVNEVGHMVGDVKKYLKSKALKSKPKRRKKR